MQPLELREADETLLLEDKNHLEAIIYLDKGPYDSCEFTVSKDSARSMVEWLIDRFNLSFQSVL